MFFGADLIRCESWSHGVMNRHRWAKPWNCVSFAGKVPLTRQFSSHAPWEPPGCINASISLCACRFRHAASAQRTVCTLCALITLVWRQNPKWVGHEWFSTTDALKVLSDALLFLSFSCLLWKPWASPAWAKGPDCGCEVSSQLFCWWDCPISFVD